MYAKMNTQSGAAAVATDLMNYAIGQNSDEGLTVDTAKLAFPVTATMPQRLYDWLTNLSLLRNVPLDYLVPDSALLPAESIRFFHIDETWIDRIVDGVFSAANTGSVDITYSVVMLQAVRATLDQSLEALAQAAVPGSKWTPLNGMTGMLIRSELVRRWPDVIVRAYAGDQETTAEMPILRAEPISKDVYIAIFAGTPALVQLREPHVGVRFGVEIEAVTPKETYYVENRTTDGTLANTAHQPVALPASRVVPVGTLKLAPPATPVTSRDVAVVLMRPPFVQQFGNTIVEEVGNKPVTSVQTEQSGYKTDLSTPISVGGLHFANVAALAARAAQLQVLRKS